MGHIIQGTGDMLLGDGDKNTSPYGGFPLRFSDEKDRGGFYQSSRDLAATLP